MNANVNFIQESKHNVLVVPLNAVQRDHGETFVIVQSDGEKDLHYPVTLGLSDEKNVEIVSGLTLDEDVVVKMKRYALPQSNAGSNPFMPSRRK